MTNSLRKRAGVAAVLLASLALTSCGLSTGQEDEPEASGSNTETITVGTRIVPETIDPAQGSNANNIFYIDAMYDRVVEFTAEGELAPSIATEWTYSDDATELTLKLRDDVVFHSGNELTADDVVYSLERLNSIGSGSAGLIADFDSAEATGDHEVAITLAQPNLNFIGALSAVYVLDSQLVAENEGSDQAQQWLNGNDAGSGPYTLASYDSNAEVQFARYDDYWAADPARPAELDVRIITESSAIRDELRAGTIDIGTGVPAIDLEGFANDDFTVTSLPTTRVTVGMMNMEGAVTSDPRVREAIQLAYDQQAHLKTALGGYGEIATSLVPAYMQCRVEIEPYEPDIERAKELVEEAGVAGQTLSIAYQPVIPEQQVAGTLLEAALREIGFNVEVRPVTFSQYLDMIKAPETTPDVAILWDLAAYPAIGPMLAHTWTTGTIGNSNFARYSNPEVDELLADGLSATDPDAACEDFEQAQELIIADRPAIVIAYPAVVQVTDKRVAEIPYSPVAPTFDLGLITLAD